MLGWKWSGKRDAQDDTNRISVTEEYTPLGMHIAGRMVDQAQLLQRTCIPGELIG